LSGPAAWAEAALRPVVEPLAMQVRHPRSVERKPGASTIALRFNAVDAQPRPDLEARMLLLTNEARQAHGLPALQGDPAATEVSRAHSQDMHARCPALIHAYQRRPACTAAAIAGTRP